MNDFPPLPESDRDLARMVHPHVAFSAKQMREYAQKAYSAKDAEMAPILAASRFTCDLCTQALDMVREQTAEIAALRKAGQQALDALMLTHCTAKYDQDCDVCNAIEAIAQAVQPTNKGANK